jgi:hypothetical protein
MSYTFQDPDYDSTSLSAIECWRDFLDYIIAESNHIGLAVDEYEIAEEILEAPSDSVSLFAFRFAKFCIIDRPTYGGPFPVISLVCRWIDASNDFVGPSWLSYDNASNILEICFNKTVEPLSWCRKTATYILLHETGHVLKNWAGIGRGRLHKNRNYLKESTAEQERTAWWWAMEIVQANMGAHAFYNRKHSHYDMTALVLYSW